MTLPSSPFPVANLDIHDEWGGVQRGPRRVFPLLRSTPLWQPTWVQHGQSFHHSASGYGRWFPPLQCGPNAFGDARKKLIGFTTSNYRRAATQLFRLFSSPLCRCSTCLANAQTIELMLVGWAHAADETDWPDEHRCWFGPMQSDWLKGSGCVCGNYSSLLDLSTWSGMAWIAIHNWRLSFRHEVTTASLDYSEVTGPIIAHHSGYES